jgi:hypothetical protein
MDKTKYKSNIEPHPRFASPLRGRREVGGVGFRPAKLRERGIKEVRFCILLNPRS